MTERAMTNPITDTAERTTTATATSDHQNRRTFSPTSPALRVRRSAPCTVPPDDTGKATNSRSSSRVSLRRMPPARSPANALTISGLVEKSRGVTAEVSRSEIPAASTTTTRAPTLAA